MLSETRRETIHRVLRESTIYRDVYFRRYNKGIVSAVLTIQNDGSVYQSQMPESGKRWIKENGEEVYEFMSMEDYKPLWTSAQTALACCVPDEFLTDSMRVAISEHLGLYMGGKLNLELLDKVKSTNEGLINSVAFFMNDVIGVPDYDARREYEFRKKISEGIAERGADGMLYELSEDASYIRCFYENRTSTYYFSTWPDYISRCNCPWKRYHWGVRCKHEIARDYELVQREVRKMMGL